MDTNDFMNKIFKSARTEINRELLESLPEPFDTSNVSDDTMQDIANNVEAEMSEYYTWQEQGDITKEKLNEKWWEMLEDCIICHNIPYYQ